MSEFNINDFAADDIPASQPPKPKHLPRHKRNEWFLKGPIPGRWLGKAAQLPGKSLHVALAIWHEAAMKRCREAKLTGAALANFGVLPDAGRRGVISLEMAGLISAERHRGRCPHITILDS